MIKTEFKIENIKITATKYQKLFPSKNHSPLPETESLMTKNKSIKRKILIMAEKPRINL
jgi:hypothetical protein